MDLSSKVHFSLDKITLCCLSHNRTYVSRKGGVFINNKQHLYSVVCVVKFVSSICVS